MYTQLTDPQIIRACQQGRGPTVQFLLERDRVGALINGMSNDPNVQQPLPMPPASEIIAFYAPFKDTVSDDASIYSLIWQSMAKFFSFQYTLRGQNQAPTVLVATKTLGNYINAGIAYPDPYVAQSKLDLDYVYVACNEVNGQQTQVMATTHPGSTSRPQVLVYDRLEGAIYPGVAQNVDTVKFAAALQQLMQACGWSLDAYSANPWTQSHNVMGLFVSQLLALTQQAPTTPQAFDIDLAYRNFVGNYTNGVPGLNPVYTEGWNGGNLEWYFYSPTYNANGPTFFFGRVGSATVYIAQKAPTAIGTPMSSLYEIMSNPVNDYTGVQLQITPVIFEAVAMGQFFDALSTARSSFLTNNTNYFNTLNA